MVTLYRLTIQVVPKLTRSPLCSTRKLTRQPAVGVLDAIVVELGWLLLCLEESSSEVLLREALCTVILLVLVEQVTVNQAGGDLEVVVDRRRCPGWSRSGLPRRRSTRTPIAIVGAGPKKT